MKLHLVQVISGPGLASVFSELYWCNIVPYGLYKPSDQVTLPGLLECYPWKLSGNSYWYRLSAVLSRQTDYYYMFSCHLVLRCCGSIPSDRDVKLTLGLLAGWIQPGAQEWSGGSKGFGCSSGSRVSKWFDGRRGMLVVLGVRDWSGAVASQAYGQQP